MGEYKELSDVAVNIVGVKKDVKSLEKRMDTQDNLNVEMRELVTSVKLLAENMKNMIDEQKTQKEQLEKQDAKIQEIMMKPAKNWSSMTKTIFNTSVGAIVGALIAVLIKLL